MATLAPAARPTRTNLWTAALLAGLFTAIAAVAFALLFQANMLWLYILAFLLIGVGPVLGYQLAAGKLGAEWGSLLGGLLGFILLILGFLLWPILVGALTRGQSIGKLLLWSVLGFLAAAGVFLLVGTVAGQNPGWVMHGWVLGTSAWGGTVGAAMVDSDRLTI